MTKLYRAFKVLFLCTVLSLQFLFVYSPTAVIAQLPDVIDTTQPVENELPKYNAGVEQSIRDYLCTPTGLGSDLYECIGRAYRFSIAFGAIALVFFIVLAGYYYITGGETGKTKGKQVIFSAFTGMAIIVFSFVLLNFINPSLTEIRSIQPPIFSEVDLPTCEEIGFGANCRITTGPNAGQVYTAPVGSGGCKNLEQGGCTKSTLNACPGMNKDVALGLRICNQESAGGQVAIKSSTDRCQIQGTNEVVSFSIGLWQINLLSSVDTSIFPECAGVLKHVSPGSDCHVRAPWNDIDCVCRYGSGGKQAYDRCVAALADPVRNTKNACNLFNTRSSSGTYPGIRGWQPWSYSYNKCKNVSS